MRWGRNFGTKLLMSVNHGEWGRRLIAWAAGNSRGAKKARFLDSAEQSHDNGTMMLMMMFAMMAWDLIMEQGRSWRISWVGYRGGAKKSDFQTLEIFHNLKISRTHTWLAIWHLFYFGTVDLVRSGLELSIPGRKKRKASNLQAKNIKFMRNEMAGFLFNPLTTFIKAGS